jgi:phage shock protein C
MNAQPNLFTRHDTFFGVCEGLGQDLGFNPNFLRVIFAVALLGSPKAVLITYFTLGAVVFLTRWFFPANKAAADIAQSDDVQTAAAANDAAAITLANAA